jgi:hypothetical protein
MSDGTQRRRLGDMYVFYEIPSDVRKWELEERNGSSIDMV